MAKRTIQSCWKQYEKLASDYMNEAKSKKATLKKIKTLTKKANADDVGASLVTLFVRPYLPLDLSLEFVCDLDDGIPRWQSDYDSENSRIIVHPIAVSKFASDIVDLELQEEDYDDFLHCRWLSFLVEIGKLPSIYLLFMVVLQRVAYLLEVAHLEKRGGVVEVAEGEAYHTMLWAFKEFEIFAKRTWSISIRAKYGISWYESEWITGR